MKAFQHELCIILHCYQIYIQVHIFSLALVKTTYGLLKNKQKLCYFMKWLVLFIIYLLLDLPEGHPRWFLCDLILNIVLHCDLSEILIILCSVLITGQKKPLLIFNSITI